MKSSSEDPRIPLDILAQLRPSIIVTSFLGTVLHASGGGGQPLGYSPDELIGQSALNFIAPEDHQVMAELYIRAAEQQVISQPEAFSLRIVGKDGVVRTWDCLPSGFTDEAGGGFIATMTCRSEQNAAINAMHCLIEGGTPLEIAEIAARRSTRELEDGLRTTAIIVHNLNQDSDDISNQSWEVLSPADWVEPELLEATEASLGLQPSPWMNAEPGPLELVEALPAPLQDYMSAAGYTHCSAIRMGIDGNAQIVLLRFSTFAYIIESNNVLAAKELAAVITQALVTQRSYQVLERAARLDPLTGVANRRQFDEAATAIDEARSVSNTCVLYIDVDGFKPINDQYGHEVGDAVLRKIAARLTAASRPQDLVARIGGDEFAVIMADVTDAQGQQAAKRLREAVGELSIEGGPETVSVTVGVGFAGSATVEVVESGHTMKELIHRADVALLDQKRAARLNSEGHRQAS